MATNVAKSIFGRQPDLIISHHYPRETTTMASGGFSEKMLFAILGDVHIAVWVFCFEKAKKRK